MNQMPDPIIGGENQWHGSSLTQQHPGKRGNDWGLDEAWTKKLKAQRGPLPWNGSLRDTAKLQNHTTSFSQHCQAVQLELSLEEKAKGATFHSKTVLHCPQGSRVFQRTFAIPHLAWPSTSPYTSLSRDLKDHFHFMISSSSILQSLIILQALNLTSSRKASLALPRQS